MIKDYFESLRQPLTTYTLYPVLVQLHCKLSSLVSIYTAVLGVVFFYLHFQGDIASCFLLFTFMHFFQKLYSPSYSCKRDIASCLLLIAAIELNCELFSLCCIHSFSLSIAFSFLHLLDTILLCYSILCY